MGLRGTCHHDHASLQSMMHLMRDRGALTEPEARIYLRQACRALLYMIEEEHVLHCDVKLGNLYLARGMVLKLGDFGLAIAQQEARTGRR